MVHKFEKGGILKSQCEETKEKYIHLLEQIGRERFLGKCDLYEIKTISENDETVIYLKFDYHVQAMVLITRNSFNSHFDFIDFGRSYKNYPFYL